MTFLLQPGMYTDVRSHPTPQQFKNYPVMFDQQGPNILTLIKNYDSLLSRGNDVTSPGEHGINADWFVKQIWDSSVTLLVMEADFLCFLNYMRLQPQQ